MISAPQPDGSWGDGWHAVLAVGAGGFLGALLRWGTGILVTRVLALESHWATSLVNLSGCLLIGVLAAWLEQRPGGSSGLHLFVVVGGLGAFTTFSTFGLDCVRLIEAGRVWAAWAHVIVQPTLGLGAVLAGRALALRLF